MRGIPWICPCGYRMPGDVKHCPCQHRRYVENKKRFESQRPTSQERGYTSKWVKARATFLADNPICSRCNEREATIVHHSKPHRGDQKLFWDRALNPWLPRCQTCHDRYDQSEEKRLSAAASARTYPFIPKPAIPVTIVCGPAGAGKSTYVEKNAGPNDVVIDLDVIRAELAGTEIHQPNEGYIAAALDKRNDMLRSLATDTKHDRAWFIVSAPLKEDRELWARKLGADVVLLDTRLDECERRIRADTRRRGQEERMTALARQWWQQHTPG